MSGVKKFDVEAVLDRVTELFRQKGFVAASLQDLEKVTGLGRGSLYNAFGDKHALYVSVLERSLRDSEAKLRAMLRGAPTALEGIQLVLRTSAVRCCSTKKYAGCFLGNATSERANCDGDVESMLGQAFRGQVAIFKEQLVRAQGEGDFSSHRDAESTARCLVVGLQGMSLLAKIPANQDLLNGIAEEILRVLH